MINLFVDLSTSKMGKITEGWKYNENLTNKLESSISNEQSIYDGDCDYLVLIKTDENSNIVSCERNIRVYIKPNVKPVYSDWSLSYEGTYYPSEDIFEFSIESILSFNEPNVRFSY